MPGIADSAWRGCGRTYDLSMRNPYAQCGKRRGNEKRMRNSSHLWGSLGRVSVVRIPAHESVSKEVFSKIIARRQTGVRLQK